MSQDHEQQTNVPLHQNGEVLQGDFKAHLLSNPNLSEEKKEILRKKRLQGAAQSAVIIFIVLLVVFSWIWISFLLPIAIISFLIEFLLRKFVCKAKKIPALKKEDLVTDAKKDPSQRTYDLVLFGATGFTGKLAARYMAKTYGTSKIKWAIAGRSQQRLQSVKELLIQENKECENLYLLSADTSNLDQLRKVVNDTRVVISTVGPFTLYGTNLLGMCAAYGTDYCDITGEIPWVREMIAEYDGLAHESGARIVTSCACDSVPWDLTTFSLVQKLKQKFPGEELAKIDFVDAMNGGFSGGTLASAMQSITAAKPTYSLKFDPLVKLNGQDQRSENRTKIENVVWPQFSVRWLAWTQMMPLAGGNACVVKRSNALLNYGKNITYSEGAQAVGLYNAINFLFIGIILVTLLLTWPFRWLLLKFALPKPGEGPTEKQMDHGFLVANGEATSNKGNVVSQSFTYYTDPGYRDTGRMIVEAGLCFILDKKDIQVGGGVWTPASCQGQVFLNRLLNTGCSIQDNL